MCAHAFHLILKHLVLQWLIYFAATLAHMDFWISLLLVSSF